MQLQMAMSLIFSMLHNNISKNINPYNHEKKTTPALPPLFII